MKNFKFFIKKYGSAALLGSMVLFINSCTKKFDDYNTNKNALANLGNDQLPFLFSAAEANGTNSGWAYQVAQNLFHVGLFGRLIVFERVQDGAQMVLRAALRHFRTTAPAFPAPADWGEFFNNSCRYSQLNIHIRRSRFGGPS